MARPIGKDWSQVLNERLKCKICDKRLSVLKYRWYNCQGYHQICQECKETHEQSLCSCGKPLSDNYCETTEELLKLDTMQFHCENAEEGCKELSGEKAMIAHQDECIYRTVECPSSACRLEVLSSQLINHLKARDDIDFQNCQVLTKGSKLVNTEEFAEPCSAFDDMIRAFTFEDKMFLFNAVRPYDQEEILHFYIHFIGPSREAQNYVYTLEFHGINPNVKTVYSGEVISMNETADNLIKADKTFAVKFDTFKKQFIFDDYNFTASISMEKMNYVIVSEEESGISDDD